MVILLIGGRNKIASQLVVDLNNQHSFKFLTNNSFLKILVATNDNGLFDITYFFININGKIF